MAAKGRHRIGMFTLPFTPQPKAALPTAPLAQKNLASAGLFCNAPGEIRTPDLRFRRPTLYPAELLARSDQV
jgi:hypothetical protein